MVRDESRYDDRATAEAARDAAPRGGRRTSGSGDAASGEECACGTGTAGKSGFRLFTGDRVLWIIVAALAVISVLVVYSSTAKMAYDAIRPYDGAFPASAVVAAGRQPADHGRRAEDQLPHLQSSGPAGLFLFGGADRRRLFHRSNDQRRARWIPLGPFQFQPSEALKVATGAVPRPQLAGRQSKIDKIRIVPTWKFWTWRSSARAAKNLARGYAPHSAAGRRFGNGDLSGAHFVGRAGVPGVVGDDGSSDASVSGS